MRFTRTFIAILLGAALWVPQVHRVFTPTRAEQAQLTHRLAEDQLRQLELLPPAQRDMARMGATNPEWELLGRGFLALALADMALADPAVAPRHLGALDRLIDETLEDERTGGPTRFLLGYARRGELERSLFVDSQIAMMLAARLHVGERAELRAPLAERVKILAAAMDRSPPSLAESYPDECWLYDHTTALAALRLSDALAGEDHRPLASRWLAMARQRLTDPATGLLVSSFQRDGTTLDAAEGSTLWVSLHNLSLIDPVFAREQYERARSLLKRDVLGFTVAREWPEGTSRPDIDSGPVVPLLEASPGSSGLLAVAAAAFDDRATLDGLVASLELAAFPASSGKSRRYMAAGQVGNGAVLHALSFGPLWKRVVAGGQS